MGPGCESNWKKIIGKPYAGKLHVRFDEEELEIEPFGYYTSALLYCSYRKCYVSFGAKDARCYFNGDEATLLPVVLLHAHLLSAVAFDLDFDLSAGSKIAYTKGEAHRGAAC